MTDQGEAFHRGARVVMLARIEDAIKSPDPHIACEGRLASALYDAFEAAMRIELEKQTPANILAPAIAYTFAKLATSMAINLSKPGAQEEAATECGTMMRQGAYEAYHSWLRFQHAQQKGGLQ